MDEGQGEVVKDISANKNDGKIVNGKWVEGKIGKGVEVAGTGHIEVPASKSTDDIMNGFTYMIWAKPTVAPPNVNTRIIERDWHNPAIQIGTTDFYGSIAVNADQASTNVRGGTWKMGEWSFVALTYDWDKISLYVNGEMVQEKAVAKPDAKPHSATPPANQGSIWMGSWKAAGWDFSGALDEAAVFNTPLSVEDINNVMKNGLQMATAVSIVGKTSITWGTVKADFSEIKTH
jgi:hypothetical protein